MSRKERLQAEALKNQWKAQLLSMPAKDVAIMVARNMLPETTGEAIVEGGLAVAGGVGTYLVVGALTPALLATGGAIAAVAAYNMKTKDNGEMREGVSRLRKWVWKGKDKVISYVQRDKVDEDEEVEDDVLSGVVVKNELLEKANSMIASLRAQQEEQEALINSIKLENSLNKQSLLVMRMERNLAREELAKALKRDEVKQEPEHGEMESVESRLKTLLELTKPKVIVEVEMEVGDGEVIETVDVSNLDVAQWVKKVE